MSDFIEVKIAPTVTAPVKSIKLVKPNHLAQLMKCECYINVGFFFDGTNNNYNRDKPKLGHSNIARLFDTYRNQPKLGYHRIYMPGVGTPFPQIAEFSDSDLGNGFGIGCEARVLYALLQLFNFVHSTSFDGQAYFTASQIRALCTVGIKAKASSEDLAILSKLGLDTGLLLPNFFGTGARDDFFLAPSRYLAAKLEKDAKPVIKECFIDVFGFSRGAAEARVFCSWLERLTTGRKFAGLPLRFRFVGLMDTVASGGFWSSILAGVTKNPGGHSGWAAPEYLRLKGTAENCVHMVAMHELRKNFPLDEAGVNGILPSNTQEFVYPGAHSDVGGGYEPEELGISVGENIFDSDSLKLAQIPLNHMFECALAAGSPLDKKSAMKDGYDPFAMSPQLLKDYNDFLAELSMSPRPLHAWMQPYLNWRWQNRLKYSGLSHVKKASEKDREILFRFNKILIDDADLIERVNSPQKKNIAHLPIYGSLNKTDNILISFLDKEAQDVLIKAQNSAKVPALIAGFFDNYVHDSLAGFNKPKLEITGYWRYRKGFVGGDIGGVVSNEPEQGDIQVA